MGVSMAKYESNIVIGSTYRDQTGIIGRAVVISFHEHACERVVVEYVVDDDLKMIEVDAARLTPVNVRPQPEPVPTGAVSGKPKRAGRRG
jgi:hypothetical protein